MSRPAIPREMTFTNRLRDAITSGHYLPNERLVEQDVATFLGTNRATVRLALARLEQDGLVVRERNRGARVRFVSERDALEIMEARIALEPVCAAWAARHASNADAAELRALVRAMRAAHRSGSLAEYADTHARFHQAIVKLSGQATIERLLAQLRSQSVSFQYRAVLLPGRMRHSLAEHARVASAIAAGDAEAAEAAMRAHLRAGQRSLQTSIAAAAPAATSTGDAASRRAAAPRSRRAS